MASNHDNKSWGSSDEDEQEDWTDTCWAEPINKIHGNLNLQLQECNQQTDEHDKDEEIQTMKTKALQLLTSEKNTVSVNRMALNDNKAGMKGLDKERINQVIFEASKGSRFYENEKKKEEQMKKRILEQKVKVEGMSEGQLRYGQLEADRLLQELKADRKLDRYIVHIDMDAFYAAVEMRDDPSLRDKPMAVGGSHMLSTSNYHARRYGVRAAMPGFIGKKLCPELVIVPTNFAKYTAVSKLVREVLADYDPNYSMVSLDEAYIDFTDHVRQRQSSDENSRTFLARTNDHCDKELCVCDPNGVIRDWLLFENSSHEHPVNKGDIVDLQLLSTKLSGVSEAPCRLSGEVCCQCSRRRSSVKVEVFGTTVEEAVGEMRFRIEQKSRLTASAGIAPNTLLAKVCSDYNKPNGQYRVLPTVEAVTTFVNSLPIRKVSGIGKVSEQMLNAIGVELCSHLYQKRALLYFLYSSISFNYFMRVCLGIGSTRIERDGERKSLSTERSFREINKPGELYQKCEELCDSLWEDIQQDQLMGKTVTLKLKTVDFEVRTRAQTLSDYTNTREVLLATAKELLRVEIQSSLPMPLRLRLMGVRISTLLHVSQYSKQHQKTITGMFSQIQNKNGVNMNSSDISQPTWTAVTSAAGTPVSPGSTAVNSNTPTSPVKAFSSTHRSATLSDKSSCAETVKSVLVKPDSAVNVLEIDSVPDSFVSDTATCTSNQLENPGSEDAVENTVSSVNVAENVCDTISQRTRLRGKPLASNTDVDTSLSDNNSLSFSELKKSAYTCPVCQKVVRTSSLNNMNKHVDKCLAKISEKNAEASECELGNVSIRSRQLAESGAEDSFSCISQKFAKSTVAEDKSFRLPSIEPTQMIPNELQPRNVSPPTSSTNQGFTDHHDNSRDLVSSADDSHPSTSNRECDEDVDRCVEGGDKGGRVHVPPDTSAAEICDTTLYVDTTSKADSLWTSEKCGNSSLDTGAGLAGPSGRQQYCCPVCSLILAVSLGRFNEHVDRCLNQPAITSILKESTEQEQAVKIQKRLSVDQSPPVPAAKRKKNSNSPKSRSIMSYLKR